VETNHVKPDYFLKTGLVSYTLKANWPYLLDMYHFSKFDPKIFLNAYCLIIFINRLSSLYP